MQMRRPARQLFGGLGAYEARTMALDPLTPFAKSAQPAIPMATSEELLSELPGYDATLLPAQAQQETASSGASQAHTRYSCLLGDSQMCV